MNRITRTAGRFVCFVMLAALLAPAAHATDFTWDGDGNSNNSGNWSAPNNWDLDSSYPQTAADNATLPAATAGSRTVTVDVPVVVNNLTEPASTAANTLWLNANLTVTGMLTVAGGNPGRNTININGQTLTLRGNPSEVQSAIFAGTNGGRIVKVETNTFYLGYNNDGGSFSGSIIVSNGTALFSNYGGYFINCTNVTVCSSGGTNGTVQFNTPNTPNYLPLSFTIAGPGYNDLGALRWTQGNTTPNSFKRPITVQADATVSIASGKTVELDTTLGGSGTLTLIGGGHLKILTGTSTLNGMIVINGGTTLSVPGALPGVTNITINAGGILNGAQAHFASATVVNNGGTWNSIDTASTWSGLGDNETWSQAANWFGAVPTGIEAIIPAAGSARDISVDVDAHVSKLTWQGGGASDTITLNADLVVDDMASSKFVNLDINGNTLFVDSAGGYWDTARCSGSGLIVKQGINTFYTGDDWPHTFTGEWVVSNGTLKALNYGAGWENCPNVTVVSDAGVSGTVQIDCENTPDRLPLRFTIAGPGYNNLGALRFTKSFPAGPTGPTFIRPITVQADATCYIGSGLTNTHTGVLDGNGVMTIIGGGTYDMNNVWTGTVSGATFNGIVAATGTVDIAGCTLSLAGLEGVSGTGGEYVLVDYASANGYLVGTNFAAVNGLTGGWLIDYDGTEAHPDAVVLVPPSRGAVLVIR